MEKTKEELINEYKKSNKERREKLAKAKGFNTGAEYLMSLQNVKPAKVEKVKKTPKSKMIGIFYVIDVLDASGSMNSGKYENSIKGITEGINDLKTRKDVKYSLVEFIQSNRDLNKAVINQIPSEINTKLIPFAGATGFDTPLYYTVYEVINNLKVNKEDKVLIKVYTDGENNAKSDYLQKAASLIKKVQKENFTVTFVATEYDLKRIMRDINIDESNTLATSNTADGFKKSILRSRGATMSYFAGADAGENVLTGFYKKGGTL